MGDLKALLKVKAEIEDHINNLKESLADTMNDIENMVHEELIKQRTIMGKETGTISLLMFGVTVKQDIPKKVEWDQDILKGIYAKIKKADDDPETYIGVKYNVAEKKFSTFPEQVKTMFNPARTIKTGKPSYKFEIKEGE